MMKKTLFLLFIVIVPLYLQAQDNIKFMLFADIHYNSMHDGKERLQTILDESQKNNVDFILKLGDFVPPNSAAAHLVKYMINESPVQIYHTIGNHDVDKNDKQTYVDFWNMPSSYYYFDKGKYRFIVLDSNSFRDKDGITKPYDKGNYGRVEEEERNIFCIEQLLWLEKVLQDTTHIHVLFSHAPINDGYDKIIQNHYIHDILVKAKKNGTRIAAVFGGHMHSDTHHIIDSINYIQMNSVSYIWGGTKFLNMERYTEEINKKFTSLRYVVPFEDPLYAIVEIDSTGKLIMKGTKSRYVKPEPDSKLLREKPYACSSVIEDRLLFF